MTRKGCLDRPTLRAIAAGRCPKDRLREVQRHLTKCTRCRTAVVSAASGVRGPGETVVLKRPSRIVSRAAKALAVAASVGALGLAWHHTITVEPSAPALAMPVLELPSTETIQADVRALHAEAERAPATEVPVANELPVMPELNTGAALLAEVGAALGDGEQQVSNVPGTPSTTQARGAVSKGSTSRLAVRSPPPTTDSQELTTEPADDPGQAAAPASVTTVGGAKRPPRHPNDARVTHMLPKLRARGHGASRYHSSVRPSRSLSIRLEANSAAGPVDALE